jgi:hypothetical protein
MANNDDVHIILEEYKLLHDYYHKMMAEWKNSIDWYFKVVSLPATITIYIAAKFTGSSDFSPTLIGSIFSIIFLVGFSMYVTYTKECSNSIFYDNAMTEIRNILRNHSPYVNASIKIDDLIPGPKSALKEISNLRLGSIKLWRGMSIAIINSAIGVCAISMITYLNSLTLWIFLFVVLLFVHLLSYHFLFKTYKGTTHKKQSEQTA